MTNLSSLSSDKAVVASILERGFDPSMPVEHQDFLQLIADAEAIDRAGRDSLPPAIARMGNEFGEIGDALMLPVAVGHCWLLRVLDTSPVIFEQAATVDATVMLVRRLVPAMEQYVTFESVISRSTRSIEGESEDDSPSEPFLLDPWMERWKTFPVLASLITLNLVQWIHAIEEMVMALAGDHTEIAELTGSASSMTIRSIHGDAGDRHLGGRAVMILTFSDGRSVVFKPKQLAISDVFRNLVDRINAAGFSTPLRVHGAVVREGHTWEAFVAHRSCDDTSQIERFYRRMGGWIRLLQVVEGRDFWLDNLIANGENPVFIDLETIMQPRRRVPSMDAAAERVQNRLDSSPLVTNIVSMQMPIGPGARGEELGCFATPKAFLSPYRANDIPGVDESGTTEHGYRTWTHPEHAPLLHGVVVEAGAWFPAIEAGYREMARTIDGIADELLQPGGLADELCEYPVRTIFRDTWTCNRIIHRSTAPPLLGHYKRRRQFLERMDRVSAADAELVRSIIAAEVRAMIALDVPFFSAHGNDDAILPPDDEPVAGFFDGTARDRLVANLRRLSPARLEEDVALLRTAFWLAHPSAALGPGVKGSSRSPILTDDWSAAASRIAQEVADARVVTSDGSSSWAALTYHPLAGIESLSPIGNDLLSGRAGLIPLFANEWQASGEDHWRRLAIECTQEIVRTIRQVDLPLRGGTTALAPPHLGAPIFFGAFSGIGGMLATLKLASEQFSDGVLDRTWDEFLGNVDWEAALARSGQDVVGGSLALGLTARPEWIAEIPEDLLSLLMKSTEFRQTPKDAVHLPCSEARMAILPSHHIANTLVRARLGLTTEEEMKHDSQVLLASTPRPGDLLGVLELSCSYATWWPPLSEHMEATISIHSASDDRVKHIQAAELALAMWWATGDAQWLDYGTTLASRWIADYNVTGSWFPNDLAEDRYRLSSVYGLPAIASIFRRISGISAIAFPMTMDWRPWRLR